MNYVAYSSKPTAEYEHKTFQNLQETARHGIHSLCANVWNLRRKVSTDSLN